MKKSVQPPSDLFLKQLMNLHSMEFQISADLPHLVAMAAEEDLRRRLAEHSNETVRQHTVIKGLCGKCGKDPRNGKCGSISGQLGFVGEAGILLDLLDQDCEAVEASLTIVPRIFEISNRNP